MGVEALVSGPLQKASDASDSTHVLIVGAAMAAVIFLLVCACYWAKRHAAEVAQSTLPVSAVDYAQLQVIVVARNQEAELEVQTDAFDTYEELRELVVDSIPEMFSDTDEVRAPCPLPHYAPEPQRPSLFNPRHLAHAGARARAADAGVSQRQKPLDPRQDADAHRHSQGGRLGADHLQLGRQVVTQVKGGCASSAAA